MAKSRRNNERELMRAVSKRWTRSRLLPGYHKRYVVSLSESGAIYRMMLLRRDSDKALTRYHWTWTGRTSRADFESEFAGKYRVIIRRKPKLVRY